MKKPQLEFTTILNDAFAQYEKRIITYCANNRDKYLGFARILTPAVYTDDIIYQRIAFAILSANSPFGDSVKALNVAIEFRGAVKARDLARYRMVPAKAGYLNKLSRSNLQSYLHRPGESWHDYRLRLREIKGLGLTKASFAVCLLYPLTAEVACIDTWIQKVFLGHTGFKTLGISDYLIVESKIATYARVFGLSVFVAQWLIWDFARGGIANNHAIFPGAHKGE